MKVFKPCIFLIIVLFSAGGCSSSFVAGKHGVDDGEVIEKQEEVAITVDELETSSIQKYEQEEALLAQILAYYEQVVFAHREGDFGLAETLIDSAFVVFGQVNIDEIADQKLVARFTSVSSSLAREYGIILMESEQISQEDPESWIPDLSDPEQFKSGQWSDEELKTIVNKISRKCDVPIDYNEKVRNSISYFQNSGRKYMTLWLQRSGRYIPMIREIFEKENLPLDLAYLCMIESGLNPKAVSPARAVGLWQFIYTTGKLYGLERNEWYDDRRDPVKSTQAAAEHLKDLFKLYDDWNLVLAAYNCGAGRVSRTIKSSDGINDYWRISLPRETSNYVPTFMAALIISKAPELFGFENIVPEPPLEYDTVEVRPFTKMTDAARCAGVDVETMRLLNCHLLRDSAPGGKNSYLLRIPKDQTSRFLAEYAKIPEEKFTAPATAASSSMVYTVRRGDTLSKIAAKYGVSVNTLMKTNNIKSSKNLKIGRKLTISGSGGTQSASSSGGTARNASVRANASASPSGVSGGTIKYKVQKEDTLWSLANRHNTTIDALVAINNLSGSSTIVAGQTLLIPRPAGAAQTEQQKSSGANEETVTYVVRKNDSLFEIALKYGVNYKDIMVWNKIKDHRKIVPGQRLVIRTKS